MNSKRGAVHIDADGTPYVMRFTTNAMVRYQDKAGETITEAFRAIDEGSKSDDLDTVRLRRLFWAALSSEHDISEDEAGDIMDAIGFQNAGLKLGEAVRNAFPAGAEAGNARAPSKKKAT